MSAKTGYGTQIATEPSKYPHLQGGMPPESPPPLLSLSSLFCLSRQSISISGQRGEQKRGRSRGQKLLRGVTLFILLSQSWKFIECDGCQLRRHNERLSLIGRGEAFPINGGETEIRAPLQRIITIKRGNACQKPGRSGKGRAIIKIEAVCSACSQPLHLHVSPF